MGFLWIGNKKDKDQETISCAGCDKLVLKDRTITVGKTRFESGEGGWLGDPHKTVTTISHYCQECDPGYVTKIVLPDGDSRYYLHGWYNVNGSRHGWHEVE
jgi:hypothetical protein